MCECACVCVCDLMYIIYSIPICKSRNAFPLGSPLTVKPPTASSLITAVYCTVQW